MIDSLFGKCLKHCWALSFPLWNESKVHCWYLLTMLTLVRVFACSCLSPKKNGRSLLAVLVRWRDSNPSRWQAEPLTINLGQQSISFPSLQCHYSQNQGARILSHPPWIFNIIKSNWHHRENSRTWFNGIKYMRICFVLRFFFFVTQ